MRTTRRLRLAGELVHVPSFPARVDLWPAIAIAVGFGAGLAVAQGSAPLIIAGIVVLVVFAAVIVRPEAVLMAWFAAILANGRWLTYHTIGPLYVTEPFLALLAFGVVVRLFLTTNDDPDFSARRRALRFLALFSGVVFLPALAGLLVRTSNFDYQTARNTLLIVYVLFAFIAASATDLRHSYRSWFYVALAGPAVALLLVITGYAGPVTTTSTGATRIAAHTFVLAFGIAPIVLIAAAREGFVRPVVAAAGAAPFLVGLIFVNHRSGWLAFVVAMIILFVKRLSAPVIVGSVAVLVFGFLLFTATISRTAVLGQEVARARTVTSTSDPNARYRLNFWTSVFEKSIDSPLIGAGFDPYPANVIPPSTVDPKLDPYPQPHNSFVALAYRVGFLPFLIALALLGHLLVRGFRASVHGPDARERAVCSALTTIVVYVGVVAAFNVFLEAPYAGPLFWTLVGLLAYVVYARPFESVPAPKLR